MRLPHEGTAARPAVHRQEIAHLDVNVLSPLAKVAIASAQHRPHGRIESGNVFVV
jgi:hypothetical protein